MRNPNIIVININKTIVMLIFILVTINCHTLYPITVSYNLFIVTVASFYKYQ